MLGRLFPVSLISIVAVSAGSVPAQFCDFMPTAREVVLNTDFTQVTPANCPPFNVAGGVFVFRNVTIPAGVTVRGVGSNPMNWVVLGDFIVNGELRVDGVDGQRVDTLNSANFPTIGGSAGCAGGNGGNASSNVTGRTFRGDIGNGPLQAVGLGGEGGRLACSASCRRGSGGGGGSFGTVGDPYFKVKSSGTSFVQQLGIGGFGCEGQSGSATRTLAGGAAGRSVFVDDRQDNDFFGTAINVQRRTLIQGELAAPVGGAGGGGGGDRATTPCDSPLWISDAKGGGGGGGGGALLVYVAGKIEVGASGVISATGGNGGGGEQAGSNNAGGGGGGGSGGMIVLYSLKEILLHTHGETYANNDYSFSVSADGGVGLQGVFSGIEIAGKYPAPASAAMWDQYPSGAMGGLGLIQLMTKPGNNSDGTNTILDDNIHFIDANGVRLSGAEKQRYLAWRGFPNQSGVLVDDNNVPTNIGDNAGDLRPTPKLLAIWP